MLDGGWRMQDVPGWLPGTEGLLWLCAMSNVAARTTAGSAVRPMGRQYPRGRKMAGGHLPGTISLIYWHGLKPGQVVQVLDCSGSTAFPLLFQQHKTGNICVARIQD